MRTIYIGLMVVGLALLLCSWIELARIEHYGAVVRKVQQEVVRKDEHRLRLLRQSNVNVTQFPSMEAVVSELDGAKGLERGWWLGSGISVVIFAAGLVSLVQVERLRRKIVANKVMECDGRMTHQFQVRSPLPVAPRHGRSAQV